jgi:hypothetical protein
MYKKGNPMKRKDSEYELKIDAYSPATIPMHRLAEYMADLAAILGEHKSVHFVAVKKGSLRLVAAVEREAEPKIRRRILDAISGDDTESSRAIARINRRLADDNGTANFTDPSKTNLIEFPGVNRFCQPQLGPFNQSGTVDGIVIRVGGEKEFVPVHIEEQGDVHVCSASRDVAKKIARHIFGQTIRAEGVGRWRRDRDGEWQLDSFRIHDFKILEETTLAESRDRLGAVVTSLRDAKNPLEEIRKLREA